VGFLDDLKRQAEALKQQQTVDTAALARNSALTEGACKAVSSYFMALGPQLEVLQPPNPMRFALDRQNVFEGLRLSDFRVDARRKRVGNEEIHDHILMHWMLKSGRSLQLTKDFLPDIEKLESRLRQSGAQVDNEPLRNPDNGRLLGRRYTFVADFVGSVRVTPHHESARVHFQLQNLDGFETVTVDFPAIEIGSARLDELARWLVGQPHAFLKDGQNVRRMQA
jgi:hypothetical protein